MASAFNHALKLLSMFQKTIFNRFFPPFPQDNLAVAVVNLPGLKTIEKNSINITELFKSAVLLAVPKKRKSIEKRRSKKFGSLRYVYKMLLPKSNILMCAKCGSYHEAGVLCATCYSKVKKETEEIQAAIEKELGISPLEQEVVVLYEGDDKLNHKYFEGKRIVEMKKPRPKLFSDNLLQKSTQNKVTAMETLPEKRIEND